METKAYERKVHQTGCPKLQAWDDEAARCYCPDRQVISREEYLTPSEGWSLYRSFQSREAAWWYFERLPDTDNVVYALVDHPTRFLIASKDIS